MKKMLEKLWKFLGIAPRSQLDELLTLLTAVQKQHTTLDEENSLMLQIMAQEIDSKNNMSTHFKNAIEILTKQEKSIKEIYTLVNQHAIVINTNMKVVKEHFRDEHGMDVDLPASNDVNEVMNKMGQKTRKKDSSDN